MGSFMTFPNAMAARESLSAHVGETGRVYLWRKVGVLSVDTIFLEEDGRGSFKFTFSSPRGEMSGRVNVGTEGPPDRRSAADKEQAAKNQILALARELAQVCEAPLP